MIHPPYVDLMKVVNKGVEEGETPVINSRYSIVMATAKRARQIVDGDEPLTENAEGRKPLSVAIDELVQEKIRILPQNEEEIEKLDGEELEASMSMSEGHLASQAGLYENLAAAAELDDSAEEYDEEAYEEVDGESDAEED